MVSRPLVFATALRFGAIAAAIILLAAIALCALTPSPNMREMWWIPGWLGEWADRNGNFRNFPVFAVFAALLFFVWNFLSPISEVRPPTSGFRHQPTADCRLNTSTLASTSYQQPATRYGRWRIAFGAFAATALLGILLEVAQLLFLSNRHFDWADIGWSTSGAFVGAAIAAVCFRLSGLACN